METPVPNKFDKEIIPRTNNSKKRILAPYEQTYPDGFLNQINTILGE